MRKITPKTPEPLSVSKGDQKMYPNFRIELAHLPEAKKWDIGSEYTITIKAKMIGLSISRYQNDAEFDIIGIETKDSK